MSDYFRHCGIVLITTPRYPVPPATPNTYDSNLFCPQHKAEISGSFFNNCTPQVTTASRGVAALGRRIKTQAAKNPDAPSPWTESLRARDTR